MELLVQAQMTREFAALSPSLASYFRRILESVQPCKWFRFWNLSNLDDWCV